MRRAPGLAVLAAIAVAIALPAAAHTLGGQGAGFSAGLGHPIGGFDHLLAMAAVGLWAAQRGGRAVWALPAAFMAAMVLGGGLGMAGVDLPGVELAILASVMAFGGLVALKVQPPVLVGMAVAGMLAVFHGHAHGAEMPEATSPALYAAGFLLATAILHAAGIAVAQVLRKALPVLGDRLVRACGAFIAASGAGMTML